MKFPEYFPKGCPPVNADIMNINVFRYIEGDVPKPDDFLSYYQLGKKVSKAKIQQFGLSVHSSEEFSMHYRKVNGFIKKKYKGIAMGYACINKGVAEDTSNKNNPGHLTWYLFAGIEPSSEFETVYKW